MIIINWSTTVVIVSELKTELSEAEEADSPKLSEEAEEADSPKLSEEAEEADSPKRLNVRRHADHVNKIFCLLTAWWH